MPAENVDGFPFQVIVAVYWSVELIDNEGAAPVTGAIIPEIVDVEIVTKLLFSPPPPPPSPPPPPPPPPLDLLTVEEEQDLPVVILYPDAELHPVE